MMENDHNNEETVVQLSVVIPAHNEAAYLKRCIEGVIRAASRLLSYQIIVVDNNSIDETVAIAKNFNCTVVQNLKKGAGSSRNMGAKVALGERIAFIDADCIVNDNLFEMAMKTLNCGDISCLGAKIAPDPEKASWVERTKFYLNKRRGAQIFDEIVEVRWIGTSNMILRKTDFIKVGGFNERYTTCEDYDICQRLNSIGKILLHTGACTIHLREEKSVKEVFFKERWRGQDSFKHWSLSGFPIHEAPSVLMPCLFLFLLICSLLTILFKIESFIFVASGCLLLPFAMVVRTYKGLNPIIISQGVIVSSAYLLARGVALVEELYGLTKRISK